MDYSKLTIPELKAEIKRLNLRLPQKGSGSHGNLVKQDYIDVLTGYKQQFQRKKENYAKYTVRELEREMEKLGLRVPTRARKRDLIKMIENEKEGAKTEFLRKEKPVGEQFLDKMPPEVAQLSLKKLNIDDILSFCQSNKAMQMKVCTEPFWRDIAKDKLGITQLAEFKTWQHLVSLMKYGSNDLFSIYEGYRHKLYTKEEAQAKIDHLIETEELKDEGFNGIESIKDQIYEYIKNEFEKSAYPQFLGDVKPFNKDNVLEEIVLSKYWVYYNGEVEVFDYENDSVGRLLLANPKINVWLINNAKDKLENDQTSDYGNYGGFSESETEEY